MTKTEKIAYFKPGDRVRVTNHYITSPDHPCYGTRTDTVQRVSQSGITFEKGGRTEWPRAEHLRIERGRMFLPHPYRDPSEPFLEVEKVDA